ncbi:type II toxin-antitoxin system VapC family toxin [Blastococcus mobilis]|uniref:PIN domain nuclease, a component of toxin-antitoxin system (PIN domain) n=1 Tax=Blastococcus mobilis TaxID=1938746 RepID=A0A238X1M4_9ACTN|nr:type II toxin-antitoxin system VapC family toxin [Blastococcus mobilis]SNR52600.1 PIN domain nuclease, a component of toxin-antitoxin system (PIN domain) [Blastococcus mobilis]
MRIVGDTHALVWFLEGDERLSARAREVLEQAQQDPDDGIVLSLASRLDLHYLHRKGRLSSDDVRRIWAVTEDLSSNISSGPITAPVVAHFDAAELAALRDPWDRLITATAIDLGLPLVTKDRAITTIGEAGAVEIIW